MVRVRNKSCIEVFSADMNEWIDCIFLVDKKDEYRAAEVLRRAYDSYWESDSDDCYGDWLQDWMNDAGIDYEAFYKSSSCDDMEG